MFTPENNSSNILIHLLRCVYTYSPPVFAGGVVLCMNHFVGAIIDRPLSAIIAGRLRAVSDRPYILKR